ncbi:hypothetical protein SAMN04489867_3061 [Pedococcus dokdonensis]|uniref:Uncharacterized protein n=1 Tax=Pedococcus dokdonensis TaxID=443156 RepID=A0A1H0U0F4_9MICO|nr:hypothetical protein [Pedococcus dokdonensis]SDP59530.1 hypothetical protein SAMN04489867_3061 [Pedococcus dokdonensis]
MPDHDALGEPQARDPWNFTRLLYDLEASEIDLPHVVICRAPGADVDSFSGPYPSALEALMAAEIQNRVERAAGGVGEVTFHVAAIYPPFETPRLPPGGVGDCVAGGRADAARPVDGAVPTAGPAPDPTHRISGWLSRIADVIHTRHRHQRA